VTAAAPDRRLVRSGAAGAALWRLGPPSSGPGAVVLLPGIEGDSRTFCRQTALAEGLPLYSVDLPALDRIAAAAGALAPLLPSGPLLLVGASFGGLVARELVSSVEGRPVTLAALGALPAPHLRPAGLARRARLVSVTPEAVFERLYRRRIGARLRGEAVPLEAAATHLRHLPTRDALAARLRAVVAWRAPASPPARAWWFRGQTDTEAPWSLAQAAAALPGVAVETLPGGHRPWLTHPGPLHAMVHALWRNTLSAR